MWIYTYMNKYLVFLIVILILYNSIFIKEHFEKLNSNISQNIKLKI